MWFACCKKSSPTKTLQATDKVAIDNKAAEEPISPCSRDSHTPPVKKDAEHGKARSANNIEIIKPFEEKPFLRDCLEKDQKLMEAYARNTEDFGATVYSCLKVETYQMQPLITQGIVDRFCKENYADLKSIMVFQEPPIEHRWKIWKRLSNSSNVVSAEAYVRLTDHTLSSQESQTLIHGDIERTFAHKFFFSKAEGKAKLARICTAVDVYFKRIRYTQGMSLILGLILQVSGGNELETFNFYLHLMKARKFQYHSILDDYFTFNQFLNFFFKQKLRKINSKLVEQIEEMEYPDDCWIGKWWISLFSGYLDEYLVVRIIDFLLVTSLVNIVDVGLAITTILSGKLEKSNMTGFNSIIRELDKNPEIAKCHPNRIISLASTYKSQDAEVLQAMEAFIACEATSAEVRQRMAKHKQQYEAFLLASQQDQVDIGHADVLLSVYSLKDGLVQREPLA
jgi:hypothetical protein